MNKNWPANYNSWRMRTEKSVEMMTTMKMMMTMTKVKIVNLKMTRRNETVIEVEAYLLSGAE